MNITIVGGGFGGIKAALELSKHKHNQITLISDKSYFQYYPALYSTATGRDWRESWIPLAAVVARHPTITVKKDSIQRIDAEQKCLYGASGIVYEYEEVIFALGSVTTYFGIKGLDVYAYGIKSESEIRALQTHLWNEMNDGKDEEKNYVIIGAGPTGVELAGTLGEYVRLLRGQFGVSKKTLRISIIEAAPRVLPRLTEKSSRLAHKRLERLGVNVETNKKVEEQTADALIVNSQPIKTQTVIWTSGVANVPFYKENPNVFSLNERGKVIVDEYLRARENVYVIGDNAATAYAGLALTAVRDGRFVARHLMGSQRRYKPSLPPTVTRIGIICALFVWGFLHFGGLLGGIIRRVADIVGYHDVLPLGITIQSWRAGFKRDLRVPDSLDP